MTPTTPTITTNVQEFAAPLTIRLAVTADAPALRRLAQRDSAPPPEAVSMLVAEVGGELHAALPLDGGLAIADPFQRTAELVGMLAAQRRQLQAPTHHPASRRRRSIRFLRPAPATRA